MDWTEAALLFALVGFAATVQPVAGFGFALLVAPPLALLIGPKEAVVVSNALSVALNAALLTRQHGGVEWRLGAVLFAGALAGMPLGLAILIVADPDVLQVAIALSVIIFTLLLIRGLRLHSLGRPGDFGAGVVSGILNTSTSMSGPPVVLYLQGSGMAPPRFRATLTAFFLVNGVAGVVLLAAAGRVTGDAAGQTLVGLPAVLLGFAGGSALAGRVPLVFFRPIVFGLLFLAAAIALAAALA
ncbi:MAG: TSUP family transporter [Tepidiformaceae bacterium]